MLNESKLEGTKGLIGESRILLLNYCFWVIGRGLRDDSILICPIYSMLSNYGLYDFLDKDFMGRSS